MNPGELLPIAVTAIFSGGLATAISAIIQARINAKKVHLEELATPAHVESVFLGSAEKAVQALVVALDRAEEEIKDLRRLSREKDVRIDELEKNLATLRRRLEAVDVKLTQVEELAHEVRSENTDS